MIKAVSFTSLAILFLCSCSSHKQTFSSGGSTVTVDSKDKDGSASIHVTDKDGSSVDMNSGKPITGYPADAPLYAGKPILDIKSQDKGRVVTVETSDSMQKILDFYKSELESKGWKTEGTVATDQLNILSASKGERKLAITVTSDGGKQIVNQSLADK